jgi:hypothetical protein
VWFAQRCDTTLTFVRNAVAKRDQAEYTEVRARLFEQGPVLYAARLRASLTLDDDEILLAIQDAYFAPDEYSDVNDCDVAQFDEALDAGYELLLDLEDVAEKSLETD